MPECGRGDLWLESSGGKTVYYDTSTGRMLYGQQKLHDNNDGTGSRYWYYFNDSTGATTYGFKYIASQKKTVYYRPVTGKMVYGTFVANGVTEHANKTTGSVASRSVELSTAVNWIRAIAADNSHGYDDPTDAYMSYGPDYDCATLVINAWNKAGISTGGAYGATYTGNMRRYFLATGRFTWITDVSQRRTGDILLHEPANGSNRGHTALYVGGGRIVHAWSNEYGGITGGATGDQTGREIFEQSYFNDGWSGILRFIG